jgi:hypothetical protein
MRWLILSLVVLAAWPAGAPSAQSAAVPSRRLWQTYLAERMGFSSADLQAVESGRAVARLLDARSPEDVAIMGAVRVPIAPAALVDRLRDIASFEKSMKVKAGGRFGTPPSPADAAALVLERRDLDALRSCRPGRCDLQLSSAAMAEFASLDWRAPDADRQASAVLRAQLARSVDAYRAGGLEALGAYHDERAPRGLGDEFRQLSIDGDLPLPLPELMAFLTGYPRVALPGAEEFFYWNVVDFGMKPSVRVNHVTIYPVYRASLQVVVATRQLYASHYFTCGLEWRLLFGDAATPGVTYLAYLTRSRIPGLTGPIGALIRRTVRGRARAAMERHLTELPRAVR